MPKHASLTDSPVHVVDAVAPVVLVVPAEATEAHANVAPRYLHAGDVGVDVFEYRLLQHRQHVQVPPGSDVLLHQLSESREKRQPQEPINSLHCVYFISDTYGGCITHSYSYNELIRSKTCSYMSECVLSSCTRTHVHVYM